MAPRRLMTVLWLIEFEYRTRLHHGAVLRFLNYSRELLAMGHRVFFAVELREPEHREASRQWLESLEREAVISGWVEVRYDPPRARNRIAARLVWPGWTNWLLRRTQLETAAEVLAFLQRNQVDAVIVSNRRFLFLADYLPPGTHLLVDFCDSMALYHSRSARVPLGQGRLRSALGEASLCLQHSAQERYYARRGYRSIVVSPVDKTAIDRLSGQPQRSVMLLNGVRIPVFAQPVAKNPRRLVFSGNMSFPPNQEAALWFLDAVLPLVKRQVPDVEFVLAGADPPPHLRARAGGQIQVTGFVPDLNAELASSQLFVAPLVSGGGFKNKVLEALAAGTYVAATPLAVEFLEPQVRDLIEVHSRAEDLAAALVRLLRDPASFEERLEKLKRYVREQMSWGARTRELLDLLRRR